MEFTRASIVFSADAIIDVEDPPPVSTRLMAFVSVIERSLRIAAYESSESKKPTSSASLTSPSAVNSADSEASSVSVLSSYSPSGFALGAVLAAVDIGPVLTPPRITVRVSARVDAETACIAAWWLLAVGLHPSGRVATQLALAVLVRLRYASEQFAAQSGRQMLGYGMRDVLERARLSCRDSSTTSVVVKALVRYLRVGCATGSVAATDVVLRVLREELGMYDADDLESELERVLQASVPAVWPSEHLCAHLALGLRPDASARPSVPTEAASTLSHVCFRAYGTVLRRVCPRGTRGMYLFQLAELLERVPLAFHFAQRAGVDLSAFHTWLSDAYLAAPPLMHCLGDVLEHEGRVPPRTQDALRFAVRAVLRVLEELEAGRGATLHGLLQWTALRELLADSEVAAGLADVDVQTLLGERLLVMVCPAA